MRFGVFIYNDVEPIDLATYGVLSMARRVIPEIEICTIAPEKGLVRLSNGLRVMADYDLSDAPACDMLIVTGGSGWEAQANNPDTLAFLRSRSGQSRLVSVCTGAMILAAAGVLDGKKATTKREVIAPEVPPVDVMRQHFPKIEVTTASVVDCGSITTGGGVTLCIDVMLHIIGREFGTSAAAETARIIEYSRALEANRRALPLVADAQ